MSELAAAKKAWFKIGAAVAIGELWCEGRLGSGEKNCAHTRAFLNSFGIGSMQDLVDLGLGDTYLEDFKDILPT